MPNLEHGSQMQTTLAAKLVAPHVESFDRLVDLRLLIDELID